MTHVLSDKKRIDIPVIIMAWIAVVANVIYRVPFYEEIVDTIYYGYVSEIITLILEFLPSILFAIYVTALSGKIKPSIAFRVIFGLFAASMVYAFFSSALNLPSGLHSFFYFILNILCFAIAITLLFKPSKTYIIIWACIGIFTSVLTIVFILITPEVFFWNHAILIVLFFMPVNMFGEIVFYIAIIRFASKFLPARVPRKVTADLSFEDELRALKENLDKGLITPMEYQTRREKIIDKL